MNEIRSQFLKLLASECKSIEDVQNLLKDLFKGTIEEMLSAEMDMHLGYEKNSIEGNNSGNSRNGYNKKTLKSKFGESLIEIPRDRNGTFDPQLIKKYQTKTHDLEDQIIAMYAKGMSTRDIEDHLRDIYGVDASAGLISHITDKIMPNVQEWQSRPLDAIYPIVFLDGIVYKVRKENKIVNKCVYTALGIDMEGYKEILGLWISDNESASFWLSICNELKNRGVQDIFIACRDNLSGFSSAIQAVFPKTEQQLCIIHQVRNSTKYVSYKDLKAVSADLKTIYTAPMLDDAEFRLQEFSEKWDAKYPHITKSWYANWAELSTFFKYPDEVRRLIYTTNAVEGFHRMLRKYTKTKTIYPSDEAIKKSIFLSVNEIAKKWYKPVNDWGIIMAQLMIFFEGRFFIENVS